MAKTFRVVLIDDSDMILKTLAGLLNEMPDVEVVGTAHDGGEAVRVVMEVEPDVAFMDLIMPGMDGHAAIRTLRKVAPAMRIVVLSSIAGDPSVRAQMERLGVVDVLKKPFDAATVRGVLDKELQFRGELEELASLSLDEEGFDFPE